MSTKGKPKCASALVPTTELGESSVSLASTIKVSDEFAEIFKLSYSFSRDPSKLSKKQIKTMEAKTHKLFSKVTKSEDTNLDDIIALGYICNHLCYGYMKIDQRKKLLVAKEFNQRCFHLIKDKELDSKMIILTMKAYCNLGCIYCKQKNLVKARETYEKAIELYLTYIQRSDKYSTPIDYEDIIIDLRTDSNYNEKLNHLYSYILYLLIDLHELVTPTNHQSLILYSHLLLIDEVIKLETNNKYQECIERATKLCEQFVAYSNFSAARTYLCIAMIVEDKYINTKRHVITRDISRNDLLELFKQSFHKYKLISKCSIKYSVALLRQSTKRLLWLEKDEAFEPNYLLTQYPLMLKQQKLIAELYETHENIDTFNYIPYKYTMNYEEAHRMFATTLALVCETKIRFCPDRDMNIYTQYILNICSAYKYMALYEKDATGRFLMRNRRTEILSNAINSIPVNNNELKHLRLQLAIAYSALIEMKLEDAEVLPRLPYVLPKQDNIVVELNVLMAKSLQNLRAYRLMK